MSGKRKALSELCRSRLKRTVRNKLPQSTYTDPDAEIVRNRDTEQKRKMKHHADRKCYIKPCDLNIGQSVLVRRPFMASKAHTPYASRPLTIVARKGSMITARTGEGRSVTRNSFFYKRFRGRDETQVDLDEYPELDNYNVPPASQRRDDLETDETDENPATKDEPVPIVQAEQSQPNANLHAPVLRRSTRVRKAPNILDL